VHKGAKALTSHHHTLTHAAARRSPLVRDIYIHERSPGAPLVAIIVPEAQALLAWARERSLTQVCERSRAHLL
jgi:long-subunit acyl-CoA synthetase (AMP-forming)